MTPDRKFNRAMGRMVWIFLGVVVFCALLALGER